MKFFLEVIIVFFLFLGPSICSTLGWSTYLETGSYVKSVHPILYFLLLYVIIMYNKFLNNNFYFINTVLILLVFVFVRLFYHENIYSRFIGNLFVPLLFGFFMQELYKSKKSFKICTNIFLLLLVVEVVLAIFERAGNFLLFPYSLFNPDDVNGTLEGDYFRSNSLLGHPLSNALCVSIVLSFIVVSKLRNTIKFPLIIMSFLALLCFNARFAIIISSVFFVIYFFVQKNINFKKVFFFTVGIGILVSMIINYSFGDRLISERLISEDSSVATRIDIFEVVKFVDVELFFFRKGNGVIDLQNKFALDHVENWILIMIFDLGILLTLYYVSLIFRLTSISLKSYQLKDKLYLFAVFIIIASSNNSLATQVPALSFFIASSYFLRSYKSTKLNYVKNKLVFVNNSRVAKLKEQGNTAV